MHPMFYTLFCAQIINAVRGLSEKRSIKRGGVDQRLAGCTMAQPITAMNAVGMGLAGNLKAIRVPNVRVKK